MRRVPLWLTVIFLVAFTAIEGCFFVANMFKFVHGGWFTVLIAGIICAVMLVWHKAVEIRRRHIKYVSVNDNIALIDDIKRDSTIPVCASNLVYFSRAETLDRVESKLMYSIVNKGPKRADHYWLIHIEQTDDPDTLCYSYRVVIPDTMISLKIRMGFRVHPRLSVFLRQIVEDLTENGYIDLRSSFPSLRKRGIAGNFRFILISRVFSPDSNCKWTDSLFMNLHSFLRRLGVSETKSYGLDTSNVTVETVPLIINTRPGERIVPEEADGRVC